MMETYWNGGSADTYNRRIPMTILSSKTGLRLLVVAALVIVGVAYYLHGRSGAVHYVTTAADKGDIVQAVTATGTVNPVVTVQVGTYVSGPIVQMLCDFNTQVKKGQLCAKIDPSTYQMTLDSFAFISDWFHYGILSLLEIAGARFEARWVARHLGITEIEAKSAIVLWNAGAKHPGLATGLPKVTVYDALFVPARQVGMQGAGKEALYAVAEQVLLLAVVGTA